MAIDGVWIPIIGAASIPIVAIGWPLARAWARRIEDRPATPAIPSDVAARLERMEQAIDSIAIEVERISEGQRFTTKLLSDRAGPAALSMTPPNEERR
ncbi:MAG: hypothetical protein JWN53_193 [Gemmatimonadetes bacterium]|jgi:hypothetical protein|nr:hypothetical protein [Gemmatimonadota bacterium]